MAGERAEGFWWVRMGFGWEVVKVADGSVWLVGSEEDCTVDHADGHLVSEWGPYLGKTPAVAFRRLHLDGDVVRYEYASERDADQAFHEAVSLSLGCVPAYISDED